MPFIVFDLALALMLIWLKLTQHIRWPWLGVLAPLWGPVVAVTLLIFVATHH